MNFNKTTREDGNTLLFFGKLKKCISGSWFKVFGTDDVFPKRYHIEILVHIVCPQLNSILLPWQRRSVYNHIRVQYNNNFLPVHAFVHRLPILFLKRVYRGYRRVLMISIINECSSAHIIKDFRRKTNFLLRACTQNAMRKTIVLL